MTTPDPQCIAYLPRNMWRGNQSDRTDSLPPDLRTIPCPDRLSRQKLEIKISYPINDSYFIIIIYYLLFTFNRPFPHSKNQWRRIEVRGVHPNLALVLFFQRTEVECGKGLLFIVISFPGNHFLRENRSATLCYADSHLQTISLRINRTTGPFSILFGIHHVSFLCCVRRERGQMKVFYSTVSQFCDYVLPVFRHSFAIPQKLSPTKTSKLR